MHLLKTLILQRRTAVIGTALISILSLISSLLWNNQLSLLIENTSSGRISTNAEFFRSIVIMILCTGIACLLTICSGWTCESITHDLRMGSARYFLRLPYEKSEHLNAGEQISRLQNEINGVSEYLRTNLFPLFDDIVRFTGTLIWMLFMNPVLTIIIHIPVVFLMWYTAYSSKIIGQTARLSQEANAGMNHFTETLLSIFPILKLYDAYHLFQKNYKQGLEAWMSAEILENRKRAALMSLSAFLSTMPMLLLFLIGGWQIFQGKTSLGLLYVFINLSGNVSGVMMNMSDRIAGFRRFSVNLERLEPVVSLKKEAV